MDHFRPKSSFSREVYLWNNWLFTCTPCNRAKWKKWPEEGYVDPCAQGSSEKPEHYFDFSTRRGRIIARGGLSLQEESKARRMIKDLNLNEWYQVKQRQTWIGALDILGNSLPPNVLAKVQNLAERSKPLSSLTRAWLKERGYPVET